MKHYRSSIPKEAKQRILATRTAGPQKYKTEYILNGKVVGIRQFDENGLLEFEWPLKNGRTHGTFYQVTDGVVTFAEHYSKGLAHGTAKQWSPDGELIGTYTMKHGTGLDLWRAKNRWGHGKVYLHEARYLKEGKWHGFEWWLNEDQKSVHSEHHFWENLQHGIQRSWNNEGRLRRGYPRYWVQNVQVTKGQYIRACSQDPNLPPFRERDNLPTRRFPSEIAEHCAKVRQHTNMQSP
ncbi:MAG: hypothetical protein ABR956_14565 [Terracidiphilus sp.]|jgi:antitoxin component YwqK of YwqJK toxin-antitoxin module